MATPEQEKWKTVGIARGIARKRDVAYKRDAEAYWRLRKEGHQPRNIDGCAALERDAHMPLEIEMGKCFDKKDRGAAQDGLDMAREIGLRGPAK